jgi:hypothetical protein
MRQYSLTTVLEAGCGGPEERTKNGRNLEAPGRLPGAVRRRPAWPRSRRADAAAALREREERPSHPRQRRPEYYHRSEHPHHRGCEPTAAALIGTREQLLVALPSALRPAEVGHRPITDLGQAIDNLNESSSGATAHAADPQDRRPDPAERAAPPAHNFADITDRKQAEQAHATRTRQLGGPRHHGRSDPRT